jgi:hypothetical protein
MAGTFRAQTKMAELFEFSSPNLAEQRGGELRSAVFDRAT